MGKNRMESKKRKSPTGWLEPMGQKKERKQETGNIESVTRAEPPEQSAGGRGGKRNIMLAKRLVYFERRRVEGAMGGEWDGDLSRDIDLLLVLEDLLAEYLSEGRRHGRVCS